MTKYYQGKYRIASSRVSWWDYGNDAAYFVTICTWNRESYFGHIPMQFSEIGAVAKSCWVAIPQHFPFVRLGAFVIMPDHVHGIVIIDKVNDIPVSDSQNFADLYNAPAKLKYPKKPYGSIRSKNKFGPQSKNLASVIRGYKAGVKKYAPINDLDFAWQSGYHCHIVINPEAYKRITGYIINNPRNWNRR